MRGEVWDILKISLNTLPHAADLVQSEAILGPALKLNSPIQRIKAMQALFRLLMVAKVFYCRVHRFLS